MQAHGLLADSNRLSAVLSSQPPKRVPFGAIIGTLNVLPAELEDADAPRAVTRISRWPSPSKSARSKRLSAVLRSQPPKRVPFGAIIGAAERRARQLEDADAPGAETSRSRRGRRRRSRPTGPKRLSRVLSSQPPNRVPFGAIIGAGACSPESFEDADAPGARDQDFGSAVAVEIRRPAPKWLSAVLSSHPPKRVPFGAIIGAVNVRARQLRGCRCPTGCDQDLGSPSPSKSPTGPKRLSAVLSSQPPNRVPFGAIIERVKVAPDSLKMPMPHGLVTSISSRPSPSKSPTGPKRLSAVFSSQPPKRVPLGAIIGAASVPPDSLSTPMPQGLRDEHLGRAVAVEVADQVEPVVGGVEQPPAEPRAVGGHHRRRSVPPEVRARRCPMGWTPASRRAVAVEVAELSGHDLLLPSVRMGARSFKLALRWPGGLDPAWRIE